MWTFVAGILISALLDAAVSSRTAEGNVAGLSGVAAKFMARLVDPRVPAIGTASSSPAPKPTPTPSGSSSSSQPSRSATRSGAPAPLKTQPPAWDSA